MTWLTWRQFRAQAVTAAVALAAFAILLAATGPSLASRFASSGITGCHGGFAGGGCDSAAIAFLNRLAATTLYPAVYALGLVVIILAPAIIGIFWGAPLIARELETRTFALVWTQGITRTRWLTVKLALTGLAAMAVTEALSLMYAWWAEPIGRAISLGASTSVFVRVRAGGRHRHARRHRRPRSPRCLDPLQRRRRRRGAARQPRRRLRLLLFAGPVRDQGGPVRASAVAVPAAAAR